MLKLYKLIALILTVATLLIFPACDSDDAKNALTTNPEVVNVAQIYNEAVEKLANAQSYTMNGFTNSSSVMDDVLTTVVTSVDCKCAKNETGESVILMHSEQSVNGAELTVHTTYITDGKYHISVFDMNYIVATNDYGDYDASMIVKRVEESAIRNCEIQTGVDGTGYQVRFEIPFGIYASEALDDMIGMFADDSLLQQYITIRANIDADGWLTSIYIGMENQTSFDDAPIEQAVVMSLKFTAYNETAVTEPTDLDSYEDRTYSGGEGQHPGDEEVPESFTGDSLD